MTPEGKEAYRKACEQTDAIFALEGFQPTEERKAIREAVMADRVTLVQVAHELREYIREHRAVEGFMASRSWA